MLRLGLLTSTAMTAVALLLSGAGAAQAQTDMHSASRDPNTRFLCTYGKFSVSAAWSSESGFGFESGWTHVAVPVIGRGQRVHRIIVIEADEPRSYSYFSVGIYSNTASGLPGNPIAVGTGTAASTCGPVKVEITPTRLKRNTTYWIEERNSAEFSASKATVYWIAKPDTRRKAYVQAHHYTACSSNAGSNCRNSSFTTDWTKQKMKGPPYVKLR